jgi:two-component system cell cycle sensor histidine kinase/response regulator CckA
VTCGTAQSLRLAPRERFQLVSKRLLKSSIALVRRGDGSDLRLVVVQARERAVQAAKERVLLVDDEPQILTALEDLLGDDYTVFKSESPERALDLVQREHDIAVVITDQRMPQMNGDEFLRRIGDGSHALRIMVSGFADLPAVLRAVNDGKVYAYVTKPWDEEDLLHKVQTAAEHFRLAQELEYERRLLRDLMDNSPDGIYFKDSDLRYLRANASFARTIGTSDPAVLVGRRLSEVLASKTESVAAETEDRRVLREQQPILDAIRQHERSERIYFTSETKAPIKSKSGSAIGIVGISRDVTERVRTSEALRESEALLQQQTRILNSILDGMGDGVVVTARDGRTLLHNKEASRLLGVAARDVPASAWPEIYGLYLNDGLTLLPVAQNPLCRAMDGEPLVQLEVRLRNPVVAGAVVAITATPLKDPSGEVTGAIALLRDVTQQRNLEQQLAQSQKMEAIGQLAGGVAHDFNNLLTVIVGCSELALEDFEQSDPRRQNVDEVLAAARHATLLTQQLLAFSRRQVIQPKPLQLNDIVQGMNNMLRRLIGNHIELSTVLRPELSLVTADQSQLEQVVLNLVVNARDAMADGGALRVETEEDVLSASAALELGVNPGRFVVLSVTDTGIGMSEETRKRLFEPFFTTKEVGKGTGLGLSTVYGIVRQNGGVIRVNSAPGLGTEFRILLPRAVRDGRTHPSVPPEVAELMTGTVLLVEGDGAVRQITARMLRSEGHTVIEASNLNDARRALSQQERVDLVLSDIGLAGVDFADELSAARSGVHILFMTGGGPIVARMKEAVHDDRTLLAKPFSRSQLLEKVQQALRSGEGSSDAVKE